MGTGKLTRRALMRAAIVNASAAALAACAAPAAVATIAPPATPTSRPTSLPTAPPPPSGPSGPPATPVGATPAGGFRGPTPEVSAQQRTTPAQTPQDAQSARTAQPTPTQAAPRTAAPTHAQVPAAPDPQAAFSGLRTRTDAKWLYVESDGMPAHQVMVGIRSWQQQVPLPQAYAGGNAWQIPRSPVRATAVTSAKTGLFRGAIALAVNGVPIFNALNNRGEDALLAGELDDWGGHSGRADDYHYHVAPLHLQTDRAIPIAFALDGYPIYGLTEPDGSAVQGLDEISGHTHGSLGYHYHASRTYPYINGGMRGTVTVQSDQIEPQPRTPAIRPALEPLRGATVTGFRVAGTNSWVLEHTTSGAVSSVRYRIEGDTYVFEFVGPSGTVRTERYRKPPA